MVVAEIAQIRQILKWIGFSIADDRQFIIDDAFESYNDLLELKSKDITDLSASFGRRTALNGRIIFGSRKTKKLKSLVCWVKDFQRISLTPDILGLDESSFLNLLTIASGREEVRQLMISAQDVKSKEASPGPLVSETKWNEWEPAFENYLSNIMGFNGVPLSYVIRDNPLVDRAPKEGAHADFVEETIACTPLTGVAFEADRSTVHQYIVSFTTGQTSEDWIKPVKRQKNGRVTMQALRDHFKGEGNATRRIAEAERLRESLHYKNERSLSFEVFLTKCQKMFNIYRDENEEMDEKAKIRFLFKSVKSSGLTTDVAALKARISTSTTPINYTTCANHLSAAVSELPDFISRNRNVSGITSKDGNPSIYKEDGSIITSYIDNFYKLSPKERKIVTDERERLNPGGRGRGRGGRGRGRGRQQGRGRGRNNNNSISKLTKANEKYKRKIAALKKKTNGSDMDISDEDIGADDAGNAFGGKVSKKKKTKHQE